MFKRIKFLVGIFLALIAVLTGSAISYFVFDDMKDRTFTSTTQVDNIAENHNFRKPNAKKSFDIYFFPSTYYMYHQRQHYSNVAGFEQNAEDLYGYVTKTITNGVVKDKIDFVGTSTNINNYHLDYEKKIDALGNNSYCYQGIQTIGSGGFNKNGFGNKAEDWADVPANVNYNKNDFIVYNGKYEFEEREPFYQVTNKGERLGYWSQYDLAEGRLLPIKYSFTGTFNPEVFAKIISNNPYSDMGDKQAWFNFKFTNWCYIKRDGPYCNSDYLYPGEAFTNKDLKYSYSSLEEMSKISEQDPENINHFTLRLFPLFNNGSNYELNDIKNPKPETGARDGIRIDYIYDTGNANDNTFNDCGIVTRYFSYSYDMNINTNHNFVCAKIDNFSINIPTANYRDIYIRGRKGYTAYWSSKYWWRDGWQPLNIYNSNLKQEVTSSVYNIYIISTKADYGDSQTAINNIMPIAQSESAIGEKFPLLKGRKLIPINNPSISYTGPISNNITINNHIDDGGSFRTAYRGYAMFYEEVIDVKLMDNIPITATKNPNGSYNYKTEGVGIDEHAAATFETSDSFYMCENRLYETSDYNKSTGDVVLKKDGTAANNYIDYRNDSEYVYKVESVDLSYLEDVYFQFRFSNGYRDNLIFNLSPLKGDPNKTFLYEAKDPNNPKAKTDGSNLYTNASTYFEQVLVETKTIDGKPKNEYVFVPKQDIKKELKGFYNIILDYDGEEYQNINGVNTLCGKFNVFIYRQKNVFIKMMKEDITDRPLTQNNFLNHTLLNTDYYSNAFLLGTQLTRDSDFERYKVTGTSEADKKENKLPDSTLPNGKQPLLENIFEYYGDERWKTENSGSNLPHNQKKNIFYLVDYVTHRIVGKYEKISPTTAKIYYTTDFKIMKNYVLYIMEQGIYFNKFITAFEPYMR